MNLVRQYFTSADLEQITSAVTEAERQTIGEIRVEIRQRRSREEKKMSVEQIARREFEALGMTRTEGRTGIILFLLLEDREFCIFADEGIHTRVNADTWTTIATSMADKFGRRQFREGLIEAVRVVGDHLRRHFPKSSGDRNELSDGVVVR